MLKEKNFRPAPLERFVEAQEQDYSIALSEIRAGKKRSHWMWYIFPQLAGLGHSSTAQLYAIQDINEARSFLAHPVLGPRLREISETLLGLKGKTAEEIFGYPDVLKLRSCATLFARVSESGSVFDRILQNYYDSQPDDATLRLLKYNAE